jgi:hypothetical protein
MHMWHHVANHLIISTDKDSNSENRIKLRVRDTAILCMSNCKTLEGELFCNVGVLYSSTDAPSPVGDVQLDRIKGEGFGEGYSSTLVHFLFTISREFSSVFSNPST